MAWLIIFFITYCKWVYPAECSAKTWPYLKITEVIQDNSRYRARIQGGAKMLLVKVDKRDAPLDFEAHVYAFEAFANGRVLVYVPSEKKPLIFEQI